MLIGIKEQNIRTPSTGAGREMIQTNHSKKTRTCHSKETSSIHSHSRFKNHVVHSSPGNGNEYFTSPNSKSLWMLPSKPHEKLRPHEFGRQRQAPTFAICAPDQFVGLGSICCLEGLGVPLDSFAETHGQIA